MTPLFAIPRRPMSYGPPYWRHMFFTTYIYLRTSIVFHGHFSVCHTMSCSIPPFQTYHAHQGALGRHLYSTSDLYHHAYKKAEWVKKSLLMTQCSNVGSASMLYPALTWEYTCKFPQNFSKKLIKYGHITNPSLICRVCLRDPRPVQRFSYYFNPPSNSVIQGAFWNCGRVALEEIVSSVSYQLYYAVL